jgi:hypothetical protein
MPLNLVTEFKSSQSTEVLMQWHWGGGGRKIIARILVSSANTHNISKAANKIILMATNFLPLFRNWDFKFHSFAIMLCMAHKLLKQTVQKHEKKLLLHTE